MGSLANTNGKSVAERNREIRQEALREQLAAKGHLQHVIKNIEKIEELADDDRLNRLIAESDGIDEIRGKLAADDFKLKALNSACDKQLKLLNKLLPDARDVESVEKAPQGVVMVLNYTGIKDEEKIIEGEEVGE